MSHTKAVGVLVVVLGLLVFLTNWILRDAAPTRAGTGADTPSGEQPSEPETPDQAHAPGSPAPSREPEVAVPSEDVPAEPEVRAMPQAIARFLSGEVRDPDGRPLAGATVLWGTVPAYRQPGPPPAATSTRTDAAGRFRLEQVAADSVHVLSIWHEEHPTLTVGDLFPSSLGLDLGLLVMERGARAFGQVQGPDGRPVPGALVSFAPTRPEVRAMPHLQVRFGWTDERGSFLLSGLPAGAGSLYSEREGLADVQGEPLEIAAGQEVGPVTLLHEEGVSLLGLVLDAEGQPVPEARVEATPRAWSWFQVAEPLALRTDAGGRFASAGLSLEPYSLTVEADGFSTAVKTEVLPGDEAVITLERTGEIRCRVVDAVDGSDVADAQFRLADRRGLASDSLEVETLQDGGYRIAGAGPGEVRLLVTARGYGQAVSESLEVPPAGVLEEVTIQLDRGAVVRGVVRSRQDGTPVFGAKVVLAPGGRPNDVPYQMLRSLNQVDLRGTGFGSVTTDEDGRFEVAGLGGGEYRLQTEHPWFAPVSETLTLEAGQPHPEVVLELGVGGTLTGLVWDHLGRPLAGQNVRAQREERDLPSVSATTAADGTYRMEHLAPGAWRAEWRRQADLGSNPFPGVRVSAQGGSRVPEGVAVHVEEGATVQLNFQDEVPCTVQGFVSTAGGPVQGALVRLIGGRQTRAQVFGGRPPEATTDAAGFYRIEGVQPGSYQATVQHPDSPVAQQATLELDERRTYDRDFRLEGTVLEGTVLSPDRRPLEGAIVTLSGGGVRSTASSERTEADGSFRMILVPDGAYRVTATHEDFRPASTRVRIQGGKTEDGCELVLLQAASVRVEVRSRATGRPVVGVLVRMREEGGRQRGRQRTDARGQALFRSLEDGSYRISVPSDDGTVERTVVVSAGGEVPVVFQL